MAKIAYQTDENGFFLGAIALNPNPRAEGEYLIPHGAVLVAPLSQKENTVQRWTGNAWEYINLINKKAVTPPS